MYALVDGNNFYVSCERVFRPSLNDRPVVVLSYAFWERRFNRDPDILQKPLRINNQAFTVVGVAEPGFNGASLVGTEVWVPMAMVATPKATTEVKSEARRKEAFIAVARSGSSRSSSA